MNRTDAKEIALTQVAKMETMAWVSDWISEVDGKFWHFQPDNTQFGPFDTRREAEEDCLKQANEWNGAWNQKAILAAIASKSQGMHRVLTSRLLTGAVERPVVTFMNPGVSGRKVVVSKLG